MRARANDEEEGIETDTQNVAQKLRGYYHLSLGLAYFSFCIG